MLLQSFDVPPVFRADSWLQDAGLSLIRPAECMSACS